MKKKWLQAMIVLLAMGLIGTAAADIFWDGSSGDTLWSTGANWNLNRVPQNGDVSVFINDQTNGPLVLVDSSTNVSIDCDIFGPEWGMQLDIDGGNLTTTGFSFAPIGGDEAGRTFINVRNGGQLNVTNLLLGDNWWFVRPYVTLNVYDTSVVTASDFIWLGGVLNLYGGSVSATNGMNVAAFTHPTAEPYIGLGLTNLNIEKGTLVIGANWSTQVNDWINAGTLTAYGLAPGRGADIIMDLTTLPGSTILTAVYYYPASNPTPADGSTGAGTPVTTDLVDVQLSWWAGADPDDPNSPVNPDIKTHYIYISDGSDTDPNVYYNGDFVDQTSLTDPNNSYLMANLSENTLYYWSIEEGIDAGTGTPYPAGDPNNILGPIWSFTTKAAQPAITDPVNTVADPDATFSVTELNGVAASYRWYKVGTATPLTDTGAYSGTQTAILTVTNATINEEGQYYCVATNGTKTDTSEPAYLWTQRLMGHWKFEQNMLDSVTDTESGAPTHDGAIGENTVTGPGDDDYAIAGGPDGSDAMEFNNDGDYVAIGGDPNFFNFHPLGFTVSFWYKQDAPIGTDAWRLPMSKLDAGVGGWLFGVDDEFREWALFFTNPDDAVEYWADGYIDMNGDGQNDINIGDGGWHMISAVYNPDTTTYTIFTDGDENESVVYDLANNPLPEAPLSIGGRITESSIDGFIDDVRIYSYPRTPLQIAQDYVAIETDAWVCVEDSEDPLGAYDLNGDCKVNLADFAEFASNWLKCQRYPASGCEEL